MPSAHSRVRAAWWTRARVRGRGRLRARVGRPDGRLRPGPAAEAALHEEPTGWGGLGRAPVAARSSWSSWTARGGSGLGRDLRVLRDAGAQRLGGGRAGHGSRLEGDRGRGRRVGRLSAAVAASGTRSSTTRPDLGEVRRGRRPRGGGGGHAALGREATEEAFRAAAGALFISGDHRRLRRLRHPGAAVGVPLDARVELVHRDRAKRQRLLRQAGSMPGSRSTASTGQRLVPGRLGPRTCSRSPSWSARRTFCGPTGRGKTPSPPPSAWPRSRQAPREVAADSPSSSCCSWAAKREGTLDRLYSPTWPGRGSWSWTSSATCPSRRGQGGLLYQVISESYERRSVIFTTNVEVQQVWWGTVFADDKLAAAMRRPRRCHGRLVEFGARATGWRRLMLGKSRR